MHRNEFGTNIPVVNLWIKLRIVQPCADSHEHKNSLRAAGSMTVEWFHIIGVFEFSQLQIF